MQDRRYAKEFLDGVTHTRQLIFVRPAKLWFVVDIMNASDGKEHDYTQMWHFHSDFPKEHVVADETHRRIFTTQPGTPNLFLYHTANAPLRYRTHYGEGISDLTGKHTGNLPTTIRGWYNAGGGYDSNELLPAVDLFAEWRGAGRQIVVTTLVPSPDTENPVREVSRKVDDGAIAITLTLHTGERIEYAIAAGEQPLRLFPELPESFSALRYTDGEGETSGMVLGVEAELETRTRRTTPSYEYKRAGQDIRPVAEIRRPTGFGWKSTPTGPVPVYHPDSAPGGERR